MRRRNKWLSIWSTMRVAMILNGGNELSSNRSVLESDAQTNDTEDWNSKRAIGHIVGATSISTKNESSIFVSVGSLFEKHKIKCVEMKTSASIMGFSCWFGDRVRGLFCRSMEQKRTALIPFVRILKWTRCRMLKRLLLISNVAKQMVIGPNRR